MTSNKTTKWLVWAQVSYGLEPCRVYVRPGKRTWSEEKKDLPAGRGHMHIRTISPNAAARKFIRENLTTQVYLDDDGAHEPCDLQGHNRKSRLTKKHYRNHARHGDPVITILQA